MTGADRPRWKRQLPLLVGLVALTDSCSAGSCAPREQKKHDMPLTAEQTGRDKRHAAEDCDPVPKHGRDGLPFQRLRRG
jgi:hypothetical protein